MSSRNEPVDFEHVVVVCVRDKALLCKGADFEVWVPKSQLCQESEIFAESEEGDAGTLVIPEWLAIDKDLV
jgi:hypothetical protein